MDVKSRDFNSKIDDLNNDGITSNILNEFHQNFLREEIKTQDDEAHEVLR